MLYLKVGTRKLAKITVRLKNNLGGKRLTTAHTPHRVPVVLIVVVAIGAGTIEVQVVRVVIIVPSTRPPVAVAADIVLRAGVEVPGSSYSRQTITDNR